MDSSTRWTRSFRNVIHQLKPIKFFVLSFGITGLLVYSIPITEEAKRKSISDRCFNRETKDSSGPNLVNLLCKHFDKCNESSIITSCVPDERDLIKEVLLDWVDVKGLRLILTTGGTGFSPRDVTPEVTKQLLDKETPGLIIAMITKSLEVTPMAMLSRLACGIRKNSLIVNLPGSKKGSEECLSFILPSLTHALDLLSDSTSKIHQTHQSMNQSSTAPSITTVSHDITSKGSRGGSCPYHSSSGHVVGKRTKEDFYPVAMRPRHSPYPMLTVEQALDIILTNTNNTVSTVQRKLKDSLDCILAERVVAKQPFPPFPASIKDGYAVISSDKSEVRDVLAPITAGDNPAGNNDITVKEGSVVRITTGAPLPQGSDAVVMVENTELIECSDDGLIEKKVKILSTVQPGEDVRSIGSDIAEGEIVLERGTLLGPSELGLAASVGCELLSVIKIPTIAVLSTGNEVVRPGTPLSYGQIYDSNSCLLLASIKKNGYNGIDLGIAKDTREDLYERIAKGLDQVDVLVTSGGVSMGEKDLLKPVLEKDFSANIHFGRVFMKPGKPTTFATVERNGITKLIFALPGNPVSAAVTFTLFVLPALRKLAGHTHPIQSTLSAKLGHPVTYDPRPEYQRVLIEWSNTGLPTIHSTGNQRSSRLLSMKGVQGLALLPPRSEETREGKEGDIVQVILM